MATKDQNSRMPISLKGIDRRPQDNLTDGSLLELINARFTNGALRPIPPKVRLTDPNPQFKVLYKHAISESVYAFWGTAIVSTVKYLAYQVYLEDVPQTPDLDFQTITGDAIFSNLGNACMISDLVLEKTFVMLFDPDTHTYRAFDKFLPDMPHINFERIANTADDEIKTAPHPEGWEPDEAYCDAFLKGTGQDMFFRKNTKGYLIGRYLVRCAWELFDGSLVMHTTPTYIAISKIDGKVYMVGVHKNIDVKFTGYKLRYRLDIESSALAALKAQYKGIVKSFNIYLTNHQTLVELKSIAMTLGSWYSMTIPDAYNVSLISNWVAGEMVYFELIRIGLDSLIAETFTPVPLNDSSTLSSGNVLPAGNLAIHRIFGRNLFAYNQRIFFGNIKNTLFQGTSLRNAANIDYSDYSYGAAYDIGMSFDLDTPDGTRRVFTGWQSITYYNNAGTLFKFELRIMIGYPDSRAKKCCFWLRWTDNSIRLLDTVALTQVFGMNFSFWIYPYLDKVGPYTDYPEQAINEKNSYWDGDRVQATEFQNPFYFPAINSYRVEGFILGMAINAVALSQGQFGQFPIFTFTTRSIWALDIGDGDILITRVRPLSGTICINSRSILGIDGGVIFMSNEGLMILSGVNPISISDMIAGSPISPTEGQLTYEHIINDPNTYQPKPYLDAYQTPSVTFETYATGANIAFSIVTLSNGTVEKEIIVSNPAYTYSYVYNIISKAWHKITQSWDTFIHDYSKTLGTKYENSVFNLDDLTAEVEDAEQGIMVHMETRPIKFGEEISFKKIMRTLLYGYLNPETEKPFTFYLFGSVDGQHWFVQQASNVITPNDKAVLGRTSFSCRSFIIVAGGYVYNNTYFQGLIADIEKRYDDKLR